MSSLVHIRLLKGNERHAIRYSFAALTESVTHTHTHTQREREREAVLHSRLGVRVVCGQDREPGKHRPQAVLLSDVVRAGAEALLTAQVAATRVHEVAEELPASGRLVAGETQLGSHSEERGEANKHMYRHK